MTGLAVDRFDREHPAPEQLMYALDADTGQARWLSTDSAPGAWNRAYVSGRENLVAQFPPLDDRELLTGPAPAAALPAPTVTTVSDTTAAGRRTLTLTITPQRPVRLVYLEVEDATVLSATVAGRDVAASALGGGFGVLFHAPPAEGLRVTLVLDTTGPVRLRVMDGSDGLDGLPGFTPRPPGVGVAGSHDSELVLVAKGYPL